MKICEMKARGLVRVLADRACFWWDAWQMLVQGGRDQVITPCGAEDFKILESAYEGSCLKISFNSGPSLLVDMQDYVKKEIIRYHGLN